MSHHHAHKKMERLRRSLRLDRAHPLTRKIIVGLLGGVCFVTGIVMIFSPGPAFIFIPLGLLLLASEFNWAKPWRTGFWMPYARCGSSGGSGADAAPALRPPKCSAYYFFA